MVRLGLRCGKVKVMSEPLKYRVMKANNDALTRHFLKLLCRLEECAEVLEVRLSELESYVKWVEKECVKNE